MYTLNKICQFTQRATFKYIHMIYMEFFYIYGVDGYLTYHFSWFFLFILFMDFSKFLLLSDARLMEA